MGFQVPGLHQSYALGGHGDGGVLGALQPMGTPLPAFPHRSPCLCYSSTCPLGSSLWSTFWVPCCLSSLSSWRTTLPTLRSTSPLCGECHPWGGRWDSMQWGRQGGPGHNRRLGPAAHLGELLAPWVPSKRGQVGTLRAHGLLDPSLRVSSPVFQKQPAVWTMRQPFLGAHDCFARGCWKSSSHT